MTLMRTTGAAVVDQYSTLKATPINGALCSATGMVFDGVDDYVDLDAWSWGGATSFEVYVKYDSMNYHSMVFCFGDAAEVNAVLLGNTDWRTHLKFQTFGKL